jgi:ABC-2 type transport system ATP-binding protein
VRVEVQALGKRFGPVTALRDVSFELPPGRRVALVGPNGSGKSTLNRALMGLLSFEGEVRLDGFSPREERIEVARRMAYVPQVAPNLGVPVAELVRTLVAVRGGSPERVEKAARRLGLELAEVGARPFRGLSGGMRQKLLIALALSADASFLILDEPTGSLDARTRERFFPLFAERAGSATVLLCSHRLEEVRALVDHVLLLDEGRLVHDGPAEAFLDASTTSLLEVRAVGEAAARWLAERGFRRGAADWWMRSVSHAEKLALLPELARRLDGALRDVTVRDVESIELAPGAEGDPDGR